MRLDGKKKKGKRESGMKRTIIRLCGTALACFSVFAQKDQAKAVCALSHYSSFNFAVYEATSCSKRSALATGPCKGVTQNQPVWAAPTGDYNGYCWCRNVTNNYAEIACLHETGIYEEALNDIKAIGGCTFDTNITNITPKEARLFGQCLDNEQKCYWKDTPECTGKQGGYANTGELNTELAGCCVQCPTVSSGVMIGTELLTALDGGWIASGNGGTGINTCSIIATRIDNTKGIFIPGAGDYFKCSPSSTSGGGTGTGASAGTGAGTGA